MTPVTSAPPELSAALSGRYRLVRELGHGGMATVYLAHDEKHGREVALKVLHPRLSALLGAERFLREIATTARLNHPNILPLFDSGSVNGLDWYVMPYFSGKTLKDRLAESGSLPIPEALRIFGDVASALDYAHREGILHRDLKPANILLQDDRAVLADFGIALPLGEIGQRLTETGFSLGTPEYMSPEQAAAERQLDARSDVYALGCVLYEMLAGEPPFAGATAQAVLAKRVLEPVPKIGTLRTVAPAVEAAITRALSRDPADRFQSVADFAKAASETAAGAAASPARPRWIAPVLLSAVLTVLLAAGLAIRARTPAGGGSLDPNLIAVLPARVNSPDHGLDYLSEGLLDFAAVRLTGEGGPRAADPRATLAAWHSLGGGEGAVAALASRLGAGKLLDASIVGDGRRVTLNATLVTFPGGRRQSPISVEGSQDSVNVLVDRLIIRLLALQSGEGNRPLAAITSLPAWRAYLEGKSAHRQGRYADAVKAYQQALAADSGFALAALAMIQSIWRLEGNDQPAVELVHRNLGRLGPSDSLWFFALVGPHYPGPETGLAQLAAREEAVRRFPDRADAWFELGDLQLHAGPQMDLDSSRVIARRSLERALALDSTFALPIDHLLLIGYADGDTAWVRRLYTLYQAHDSLGDRAGFYQWRTAVALGDSGGLPAIRARFPRMPDPSLFWIISIPQYDGIGLGDAALALQALTARAATAAQREDAARYARRYAFNRGHPAEGAHFRSGPEAGDGSGPVIDALWWDGDTVAGAAGAALLERAVAKPTARITTAEQWSAGWYLTAWQIARGELGRAESQLRSLRSGFPADWPTGAAVDRDFAPLVLEAWLAAAERRSDAPVLLTRLDSALAVSPNSAFYDEANLTLGRLLEASGARERAYRAYGRISVAPGPFVRLRSTFLRQHARLGAALGHRDEAISDYRVYLALRSEPDARLIPARDSARAELARLLSQ